MQAAYAREYDMTAFSPLENILFKLIRDEGPISVETFMRHALLHPEHGYYSKNIAIGRAGDFITAPEISQVFGELVGAFLCDVWVQIGRPDPFCLVEFGPGRGTLMEDALRAARTAPGFLNAMNLHCVEANKTLRKMQSHKLENYRPVFHESLDTLPEYRPLLCVANEFLDALPIRQYEVTDKGFAERRVCINENYGKEEGALFRIALEPCSADDIKGKLTNTAALKTGDIIEISPEQTDFVVGLSERLKAQGGLALFIDYGYDVPAAKDTLQALSSHKYADPLTKPGERDMTAHVDFLSLRMTGVRNGMCVFGPKPQGEWLALLGIEHRRARLVQNANNADSRTIESGIDRLINPGEMGSLFKVMVMTADETIKPAGL